MARHYSPTIAERLNRIFGFRSGDAIDNEVEGTYAVVPLTPTVNIVRHNSSSSSGNISLYTTPTDKDFYLTGILLSIVKDATCDVATGTININTVINGATRRVADIAVLTTTAQSQSVVVSFPFPLKVDRNVAFTISGTFTVGNMSRTGVLQGYTEEATAS